MYIKGIPDYSRDGKQKETGLFAGIVSQDGELKQTQNGKEFGSASVRAFNRKGTMTKSELDYLAFSARYITFEQVLRFLMDYIDGDTYYKTKYPEHNLVRTRAQYKLLQSMEQQFDKMEQIVRLA